MFNDIFSLNLVRTITFGEYQVKNLAVKQNILGSEVMFYSKDKHIRMLVCELPDQIRNIINDIERETI